MPGCVAGHTCMGFVSSVALALVALRSYDLSSAHEH